MKSLLSAAAAAAILATAWSLSDEATLEQSPATAESPSNVLFTLHLAGVEKGCALNKGVELSNGLSEVSVGPKCGGLVPELAQARFWRENADGTVTIADQDGGALIEFAVADGLAYESFRPGAPMVSLVAE